MRRMDEPRGTAAADALLAGLNDSQFAAVTSTASPLAILAGAGSGKTRVLTRRIAHRVRSGEIEPAHTLAITFTRKAAAELRDRLHSLHLPGQVTAGTFHAIAFAQLRQRWDERGIEPPEVLSRKVGVIGRLVRARSATLPMDLAGEIEWAKARLISAADYPAAAALAQREPPLDPAAVAEIYQRYEDEKLRKRLVDFDDLLRLATRDIVRDPDYAAARRWRIRHVFVDEFQDVNPLQHGLLQAWLGDQGDLCVVGDPNQAIYAWNGADADYLRNFDQHHPGGTTVALELNYRSTPQILGLANVVLTAPIARERGESTAIQLRPTRRSGPLPTVADYDDEITEARFIAQAVRDAHGPGRTWSQQAVLVRTNAQLAVIEQAFTAARIPFRSRGGGQLLDQPEIRDALDTMRRGPGQLSERLDELAALINTEALADDAETPVAAAGAPDDSSGTTTPRLTSERRANLAELVRLGREYLGMDPAGGVGAFRAWLTSTLRSDDQASGRDAVDLATFHAAKGLEWPVVHIAGLEDGLVPIRHAETESAQAEERRLLYVALTRAGDRLSLSWCRNRTFGTRTARRRPSPYLEFVEMALEMLNDDGSVPDISARLAERRRARRTPAPARPKRGAATADLDDAALARFELLKTWRLNKARAADVPAFVIFNDATLAAIAAAAPDELRELLRLPGIGAVKAERFGAEVIEVLAQAG
jgi:DNA helicase-2/ATP-dependent DNA helicase PcrA